MLGSTKYKPYGLVTICSYHKCFIFSMHRLKLDCCMLAYFLCSSWSTSTQNTVFLSLLQSSLYESTLVAWQFLELQVCYLSSSFLFFSFTAEVSFSNPQKFLCAKFGKQIYSNSLTQLKFRSVILIYHAVKGRLQSDPPFMLLQRHPACADGVIRCRKFA